MSRGPFTGVTRVVIFNWPIFLAVDLTILAGILWGCFGPVHGWIGWVIAGGGLLAEIVTLGTTWWIYDRSPLYRFGWLTPWVTPGDRLLNVTVGFDESSAPLRECFPDCEVTTLALQGPEVGGASIERARRTEPAAADALRVGVRNWPAPAAPFDLALFFFAAHEVRDLADRRALFQSAAAWMRPGARAVVVEHPRDFWNTLVYGFGAFHFLPAADWLRTFEGHWQIQQEGRCTRWVRIYILRMKEEVAC